MPDGVHDRPFGGRQHVVVRRAAAALGELAATDMAEMVAFRYVLSLPLRARAGYDQATAVPRGHRGFRVARRHARASRATPTSSRSMPWRCARRSRPAASRRCGHPGVPRRIAALDDAGPSLAAVIEVNPDAEVIARRSTSGSRAARASDHCTACPSVKANIDTADQMATSAGSLALAEHRAAPMPKSSRGCARPARSFSARPT